MQSLSSYYIVLSYKKARTDDVSIDFFHIKCYCLWPHRECIHAISVQVAEKCFPIFARRGIIAVRAMELQRQNTDEPGDLHGHCYNTMNDSIKRRRNPPPTPMVTVATVVLNGAGHIENTIVSVLRQDYGDFEYIIVDGGSSDGTLDIITRYKKRIRTVISEPDNGLYDAMNKAAAEAKGEWIIFMNAGDTFFSNNLLSSVFHNDVCNYDLLYGDTIFRYSSGLQTLVRAKPLETIWKCMPVFHQAMIVRTALMKRHPFGANNLSADHEFLWTCLKEGCRAHYTGMIVSVYLDGGISAKRSMEVLKSRRRNAMKISPSPWMGLYYAYCCLKQGFRNAVRKSLPKPLLNTFIRVKNRKILYVREPNATIAEGNVK